MNSIRNYINIIETFQDRRADIVKISQYITRVTNHGTIINLKNVNQSISIYDVPIPITQLGIGWRAQIQQDTANYMEINLFYEGNPILFRKLDSYDLDLPIKNYLSANRREILKFLNKVNLGFSKAALKEFTTHCRIESVVADHRRLYVDSGMISCILQREPMPQIMSELFHALEYKTSMDDINE